MRQLYLNGDVITMAAPETAEAVLVRDGAIEAVGTRDELERAAPDAERIDLDGCALLPAFLDAHSHFSAYASSFLQAQLGGCKSLDEIAARVRGFIGDNGIKPGEWVTATGYDHTLLAGGRHPALEFADFCVPDNPLVIQHASGHVGVFNSAALRALGVTEDTPSPDGGKIGSENGRLTGYMEENAYFRYVRAVPAPDGKALLDAYGKAQRAYASHGITTAQEGMAVSEMLPMYRALLDKSMLKLDVVAYAEPAGAEELFEAFPDAVGKYDRHFKIGGYKIFLDGSPQARTAWMRTPYLNETPPHFGSGSLKRINSSAMLKKGAQNQAVLRRLQKRVRTTMEPAPNTPAVAE